MISIWRPLHKPLQLISLPEHTQVLSLEGRVGALRFCRELRRQVAGTTQGVSIALGATVRVARWVNVISSNESKLLKVRPKVTKGERENLKSKVTSNETFNPSF